MTKREWKIGDLAVVTTKSGVQYRGIYQLAPGIDHYWGRLPGEVRPNALLDPDVSARPLVVIDPEDFGACSRLRQLYEKDSNFNQASEGMQQALREFANPSPPKPEEPKGLGAVVESASGRRYIRQHDGWWRGDEPCTLNWAAVNAVKVLSEGVDAQ